MPAQYRWLSSQSHQPKRNWSTCTSIPQSFWYSFIGSCSVVLCGILATAWACTKYCGGESQNATLYLGPSLVIFGVLCLTISAIVLLLQRSKKRSSIPTIAECVFVSDGVIDTEIQQSSTCSSITESNALCTSVSMTENTAESSQNLTELMDCT